VIHSRVILYIQTVLYERKGHDQGENINSLFLPVKLNKQKVHRSFSVRLALSILQGKRPEELWSEQGSGKELGAAQLA